MALDYVCTWGGGGGGGLLPPAAGNTLTVDQKYEKTVYPVK